MDLEKKINLLIVTRIPMHCTIGSLAPICKCQVISMFFFNYLIVHQIDVNARVLCNTLFDTQETAKCSWIITIFISVLASISV